MECLLSIEEITKPHSDDNRMRLLTKLNPKRIAMAKSIYYTIYRTVNLINLKEYTGKHITTNPNDRYLGSGEATKNAIKKYGRDNFVKEIIFLAFDEESMEWAEKQLVDKEYVARKDTYNLQLGGGNNGTEKPRGMTGKHHSEETITKLKKPKSEEHKAHLRKPNSEKHNANISAARKGKSIPSETRAKISATLKGMLQTEETKLKKSIAMRGKKWINNGLKRKRVSEKELYLWLEQGWKKGKIL